MSVTHKLPIKINMFIIIAVIFFRCTLLQRTFIDRDSFKRFILIEILCFRLKWINIYRIAISTCHCMQPIYRWNRLINHFYASFNMYVYFFKRYFDPNEEFVFTYLCNFSLNDHLMFCCIFCTLYAGRFYQHAHKIVKVCGLLFKGKDYLE